MDTNEHESMKSNYVRYAFSCAYSLATMFDVD